MKALLFINGEPPKYFPDLEDYAVIACSDGALNYLKDKDFPIERLDFVSGDFDSYLSKDEDLSEEKFISTPDQNKTDFHKALEILIEKGVKNVDVYGGSGGEMDHFLGNLSVAYHFKDDLEIIFYDKFQKYFFAKNWEIIKDVEGSLISLYPFPVAENIVTNGLNWELYDEKLSQIERIGTRNYAIKKDVEIKFGKGNLLLFIGEKYL